jgi:hypothetical protein
VAALEIAGVVESVTAGLLEPNRARHVNGDRKEPRAKAGLFLPIYAPPIPVAGSPMSLLVAESSRPAKILRTARGASPGLRARSPALG